MTATKRAYVEILHNRHDEFKAGRDIYGPFDTILKATIFADHVNSDSERIAFERFQKPRVIEARPVWIELEVHVPAGNMPRGSTRQT